MKRLFNPAFFAMVLFIFGLTGCTEDPSPSPTDPRESYVGTWGVNESGGKQYYEVNITLDAGSTTSVLIYNFANSGNTSNPAVATVSETNITLVPDQVIGDGWTVNGGGALTGSTIMNWSYSINDNANLNLYTATFTKL